MKVLIIGAGAVGSSIARELAAHDHEVIVVERRHDTAARLSSRTGHCEVGDASEPAVLRRAGAQGADVLVAATGDDRVNLVVSLLGRSEFGVGRTVARVNNPLNRWLFDESWGVDVAVSTPDIMTALVEEAVETGDLVRLMGIGSGAAALTAFTVPRDHWSLGRRIGSISWPDESPLVAILRDGRPRTADADEVLAAGDEVFFLAADEAAVQLRALLVPGSREAEASRGAETDQASQSPSA
ncbi:TrkA family potassium uptake protein [Micrococcus cohnii]|uniref:Trk system potassium uptake protein TrkA n=1 Tax=Micrococcus cohnii TaxID=993416 RepID=A0A7W7GNI9_9MICC|nr:TrkA family potassium uptake protein [Micrococcus cohnii]MBB4735380.1 trk system potassium uptake protein TrkA [Micrococcus cohnii]